MGYALLIVESLAWSLLLVAIVLACAGRLRRAWLRLMLALPVPLVLLALHVGLTAETAQLQFAYHIGSWFYPMLGLTIAVLAGTIWLMVRGLRRLEADGTPCAAANWPRGKLAIGLVAAVALYGMTFWNLDLAARQQLAALRVEAGAVALSVAPPRVPDRDNAALVYQRAFEAMGRASHENEAAPWTWQWDDAWAKAWDEKWTTWQDTGEIGFDVHDPELRRFLARQAPALKLFRQAAAMPGCYFDRDYGRPSVSKLLPELLPLRRGGHLLALDAISSAAIGNYRQSIEDMNATFRMAEHLGDDPLLVSEFVAIAVDRLGVESLQLVLANYHVPAAELAAVKIPDTVSFRVLLQRGLRGEEALRLATFDDVGSGRLAFSDITNEPRRPPWFADPLEASAYRVFMLGDDLAAHHDFTIDVDRAARLPFWQGRERLRRLEAEVRNKPGGVLTAILFPAVSTAMKRAANGDARRDVARIGLALYAYRAKNGRFPAKLDGLAPEYIVAVPPNPFDGKPMKLTLTEGGMTVDSSAPEFPEQADKSFPINPKNSEVKFTVPDVGNGASKK